MYWGCLAGLVIGIPGGPIGMAFGFLIGLVFDTNFRRNRMGTRLARFFSDPANHRVSPGIEYVASTAGIAVILARIDGPVGIDQIKLLLEFLKRRAHGRLNPIVDDAIRCAEPHKLAELTRVFAEHTLTAEREELIVLLSVLADRSPSGLTARRRAAISQTADILGVEAGCVAAVYAQLDDSVSEACRILGVAPNTDLEEIRRVYRALAAQFHPDSAGGLDAYQRRITSEAFIKIKDAYDTILGTRKK